MTWRRPFAMFFRITTCFLMLLTGKAVAQECGDYEVTAVIVGPQCGGFGLTAVVPSALNENGDVVGLIACLGAGDQAFLWTSNTGLQILEMPAGNSQSRAIDINNHPDRQIVGTVDISEIGGTRVFFIDGDALTLIHPPNNGTFSSVAALNNQRQVVGNTSDGTPYSKAYIWEDGVMTIIEPTFGPRSAARDINEAGVVVGWMGITTSIDSHPFVWECDLITDIGLAPKSFAASANAVSDDLTVLISSRMNNDDPFARITASFLWEKNQFTDLGTLPGYDVVFGFDVNNDRLVVGLCRAIDSSNEPDVGFIWQAGVMNNLNDLIDPDAGLAIDRAVAINNLGEILAQAHSQELDATVAVILTPVKGPLGDLNGDCVVNVTDLLILLASWGLCDDCANCPADLNADCVVSTIDLLILLSNWR